MENKHTLSNTTFTLAINSTAIVDIVSMMKDPACVNDKWKQNKLRIMHYANDK